MADIMETTTATTEATGIETAAATVATEQKPMSFDEFLKLPGNQAEFDRRMQKGIKTAEGKFKDPRVAELETQLTGYKRMEAASRAGIPEQYRDYAIYEVSKNNPEDFDAALKAFAEANPQFAAAQPSAAQQPAPAAWGQAQSGTDAANPSPMSGVEAAFRRNNPNLKY